MAENLFEMSSKLLFERQEYVEVESVFEGVEEAREHAEDHE